MNLTFEVNMQDWNKSIRCQVENRKQISFHFWISKTTDLKKNQNDFLESSRFKVRNISDSLLST